MERRRRLRRWPKRRRKRFEQHRRPRNRLLPSTGVVDVELSLRRGRRFGQRSADGRPTGACRHGRRSRCLARGAVAGPARYGRNGRSTTAGKQKPQEAPKEQQVEAGDGRRSATLDGITGDASQLAVPRQVSARTTALQHRQLSRRRRRPRRQRGRRGCRRRQW